MPSFMQLRQRPLILVFLLSVLIQHVFAIGIDFTTPGGGATWPAGPITINWTDAGGSPNMAALTTYTLELMVGGNSPSNSKPIQTIGKENSLVSEKGVEDEIQADIAQSIQNGFYFMMTSNTSDGNQVINYSDRFTLQEMNGTTDEQYLQGANKEAGAVDNVPEAQYNVISKPSSSSAASTPSATSTASSTATTTATSTPPPDHSPDGGMSGGTLAGLITGAIFAIIGLVSLVVWAILFARRVRRKRQERLSDPQRSITEMEHGKAAFVDGKAELPAHSASSSESTIPKELSSNTAMYEMHGDDTPVEAPGPEMIYELEGDYMPWEAGSGRKSRAYHDPTL